MDRAYTHSDFVRLALAEFPELAEDFDASADYPRLQMSAFARRLQRAKGEGGWDAYGRGARLAAELWRRPDHDLHGELSFTLMKALDFEGPRGALAWDLWTRDLQRAWLATRRQIEELTARPKKVKGKRR